MTASRGRVAILTYGSRGDVEPFVALGHELRLAGHPVRIAAPGAFRSFVEGWGLEFVPIPGDPDELGHAFAERAGLSLPRMVASMIRHVLPIAGAALRSVQEAAGGADLIVHSFLMTDAGRTLARQQGVPDVSAQFFPIFVPTATFPAVAAPDLPFGGLYRRSTHVLNTAIFRYGGRLLYRRLRSTSPGLPELARWPFSGPASERPPILFAYSPSLLPPPPDWPPNATVTGYWRLPLPPAWSPPESLDRFLKSGPPPVYFGPGSMRSEAIHRLVPMLIDAAASCGLRVVVGGSAEAIGRDFASDQVIRVEGIPHQWLFPRMRYILHHGGAGTTGSAAAAGIPSSAIAFSADQAFWARRIARLGLGPGAPPAKTVTHADLGRLLEAVLKDSSYEQRARVMGEAIRKENGAGAALAVIEACLGEG